MRVVLQRVAQARVRPEGHEERAIGRGYLLLIGLAEGDTEAELIWMADKLSQVRLFPDDEGRMNRSLGDVGGQCLAISQFTLLADTRKGRRPSFVRAMKPEEASPLFDRFVELLAERVGPVPTGVFGCHMEVELLNDGPVTIVLEREPQTS